VGAGLDSNAAPVQSSQVMMQSWRNGGSNSKSAGGPLAAAKAKVDAMKQFCTQDAVDAGVPGCEAPAPDNLQGANIDASKSVLADTTLTPDQAKAADQFVLNVNPNPVQPLPKGYVQTEAGVKEYSRRMNFNSTQSVADKVLFTAANNRKPMQVDPLTKWVVGTAAQVSGMENRDFSQGVSFNDWYELRSKAWFFNTDFLMKATAMQNQQQNIKDLVMMNSFMVYQNWQNYKLLEQIAVTNATQLSVLNEMNKKQGSVASGSAN
jgi:hypothetical protein